MWASTKAKGRVPALEKYLVKPERGADTAEAKARRNLAAVKVLAAQFGLPLRQGAGGPVVKDP